MRAFSLVSALALVACTSSDETPLTLPDAGAPDAASDASSGRDAAVTDGAVSVLDASSDLDAGTDGSADAATDAIVDAALDASLDATVDAGVDAATCPTVLLTGGTDVAAQGWSVLSQGPAALTYGADYVQLETSTAPGGRTSGQLLLSYAGAVSNESPFKLEVVLQVDSVNPHNALDSAAAILGSFTPPVGSGVDRSQMIYLDSAAIGWSDDSQSAPASVVDAAAHTYVLSVDAQKVARVSVDGVQRLTRNDFTTDGRIAIGDQTNDPNVDAVLRIKSVTKLCP